jgi:hypothetical protein
MMANFGSSALTSNLVVSGTIATVGNTYPAMANNLWFPSASSAFPATPSVSAQGSSLNIFSGSFTILGLIKVGSPAGVDMPVLEFLGASAGQVCAALRTGYSGLTVEFLWNSACTCSPSTLAYTSSGGIVLEAMATTTMTSWTHFAFTYNANTNIWAIYANGMLLWRGMQALGSQTTTV